MNEQFKKLMVQAIEECKPDNIPTKEKTLQRYGELIIQECMEIVLESDPSEKMSLGEPYGTIIENIKEHFGWHDE